LKLKYLSYFISERTPLYGNGQGISIIPDKELINGDSCNTTNISFPNHSSTHIDLPCHFNSNGKNLNDYLASYWEFNHVKVVDLSSTLKDSQIIEPELINLGYDNNAEILIIKTGYGKFRGTDRYTITPPGLSSKLAPFLRQNFPKLRCLGVDLISISSYSNREEGRKAHHAFLNPNQSENPILLIEDMKLDDNLLFKKIIVAPLLIDRANGTPCTIIGYFE